MSETATRSPLPSSSSYSYEGSWRVGILFQSNVLTFSGEAYDAMRRAEIAAKIPTAQDLYLVVGDAPREWLTDWDLPTLLQRSWSQAHLAGPGRHR